MAKIVVLPGVGFHSQADNPYLLQYLKDNLTGHIVEYYDWHNGMIPIYPSYDNWLYKSIRAFFEEIAFDFEYAIRHSHDKGVVPEADIYVAHSAGSIFALSQNKPCVIFGSPAALIEEYQPRMCNNVLIVNIVNQYDILAIPIRYAGATNLFYKAYFLNPIKAHTDYWSNKTIAKSILENVKSML
jgi:hypothetical protein